MRGADRGSIAKMPHQNHLGSRVTKWKMQKILVEVEAAMAGDFIEHAQRCQAAPER